LFFFKWSTKNHYILSKEYSRIRLHLDWFQHNPFGYFLEKIKNKSIENVVFIHHNFRALKVMNCCLFSLIHEKSTMKMECSYNLNSIFHLKFFFFDNSSFMKVFQLAWRKHQHFLLSILMKIKFWKLIVFTEYQVIKDELFDDLIFLRYFINHNFIYQSQSSYKFSKQKYD
jgi:hypothetical protein